jgi:predicted phage terminase large subunit-like protein
VPARTRKHLREATVTAASPKAITTGQHYTKMFFDDLVNANNFRNVELLDKLESEFYHFLPLLDPGGEVLVTGTRYSFADLYARIIAKDKGIDEWVKSVKECYRKDGSLLFPATVTSDGRKIGFTPELLAQLKRDDPEMFVPQYLNRVMAGKDQLFPPSLLAQATKSSQDADYPKNAPCIFVVDLASGKRADADNSVVAIGRVDMNGRAWIADVVGGVLTPHALALTIISKAVQYRPSRVLIEKRHGAEFFGEFLKTVAREKGVVIPVDYTTGGSKKDAKYMRIASLESAMKQKRLFLLAGITDYAKTSEEFEQFPRGRHDDRPDSIALLYAELSKNVPFQPVLRQLPWIFDTPYAQPIQAPTSPLGDGFVC